MSEGDQEPHEPLDRIGTDWREFGSGNRSTGNCFHLGQFGCKLYLTTDDAVELLGASSETLVWTDEASAMWERGPMRCAGHAPAGAK